MMSSVKYYMTSSPYFKTLFTEITEEKPGIDFYPVTAIVQLIVIVYLILLYTQMDPNYSNNTVEDPENFIFSGIMVLFVFAQIAIMVFDRYLYLAKKFVKDNLEIEDEEDYGEEIRFH